MAEDIANYLIVIRREHIEYLGLVRQWANIKMAVDEDMVWVKDITHQQINSVDIKSIPYKTIYQNRNNQLFLPGHYVPQRKMPHLLWTPIDRAIQVTLPPENHNYFGVAQIPVQFTASSDERAPNCLITAIAVLQAYIQTAPAVRLKNLDWVIINDTHCIIMGSPLLPLPGDTLWQHKNFLLPAGLELRLVYEAVNEKINSANDRWIFWNKDGRYFSIKKEQFKPLSISSFRLSFNLTNENVPL